MSARGVVAASVVGFLLTATAASAAVTAEFVFGTLTASSDADDAIAITCTGGTTKVNGGDPEGDPAPCGAVESVEILGGPGPNAIDLTGLTAAAFPAAEDIAAYGDEGNDTITGSPLADAVDGDEGDDTLRGAAGDDRLDGDDGSDTLLGGAGDDTLVAADGNDSLDGQAGSDTYRLDLFESTSSIRVADTGAEGTDAIDLLECEGVTVQPGRIVYEGAVVTVTGVETYPCGFVAPPAPPAPPPARAAQACVVPRLRGRTLARARVLLARAHCSVGRVTRVRSRVKRGVVLRQRPAAGSRRPRGAKVSLRVSRGP
jgi:Ca2+-binding RTX toxin-like protein